MGIISGGNTNQERTRDYLRSHSLNIILAFENLLAFQGKILFHFLMSGVELTSKKSGWFVILFRFSSRCVFDLNYILSQKHFKRSSMELSVIPPESQIQQTGIKLVHIQTRNPRWTV